MRQTVIYIFLSVLLLTACERRISYVGDIDKPKLVMQAEVGEGDTIVKCFVSRSRFFLDDQSYNTDKYLMPDAVTQMKRGEQDWQTMTYSKQDKAFIIHLNQPLKAKETISLRAAHPDYDTIFAEQTVVHQPLCWVWFFNQIPNTFWKNKYQHYVELELLLQNYNNPLITMGVNVKCSFTLTHKENNRTTITHETTTKLFGIDELFASADNVYAENEGFNSRYELFFATGYENAKFLSVHIPYSYTWNDKEENTEVKIDELEISFNAHSKDSYLYRKSMYTARHDGISENFDLGTEVNDMIGIEEDVQIYSNVQNGYGIFAACSRYKIALTDIKTIKY